MTLLPTLPPWGSDPYAGTVYSVYTVLPTAESMTPVSVPSLVHALTSADRAPYQPFIRDVMLGAPGHTGRVHPAHWDAGATVSLIPAGILATLPGSSIYKEDNLDLCGVGGPTFTSLGLVQLTLYLTPYSKITHDFRVLRDDQLRLTLIGGDILQVFYAHFDMGDRTVRLMAPNQPLEWISFNETAQWPDPDNPPPSFVFETLVDRPRTPGEARLPLPQPQDPAHIAFVAGNPRPQPAAYGPDLSALSQDQSVLAVQRLLATEQQTLTDSVQPRMTSLLEEFPDVFVTDANLMRACPPCPTPQVWDLRTTLIADPPRKAFSRPPTQDPIQRAFFAHWIQRVSSSGARKGAQWANAISRASGELHYVAPARAITKQDGDYSGPVEQWDLRVIVDYREVNANTALPGRYACPNMQDLLHSVAPRRYKTKMDLRHGFFNVGIADEFTRRCYAFLTPHGIFLPNVTHGC